MNKEYIEREALLKEEQEIYHWNGTNDVYGDFISSEIVRTFPAANVAPIVYGEWIPYPSDAYMKCSVCGMEYPKSKMPQVVGYCPNCGAKMDGGNK